jgi:mannan endo-1,6-alpha-mannosidase
MRSFVRPGALAALVAAADVAVAQQSPFSIASTSELPPVCCCCRR